MVTCNRPVGCLPRGSPRWCDALPGRRAAPHGSPATLRPFPGDQRLASCSGRQNTTCCYTTCCSSHCRCSASRWAEPYVTIEIYSVTRELIILQGAKLQWCPTPASCQRSLVEKACASTQRTRVPTRIGSREDSSARQTRDRGGDGSRG